MTHQMRPAFGSALLCWARPQCEQDTDFKGRLWPRVSPANLSRVFSMDGAGYMGCLDTVTGLI